MSFWVYWILFAAAVAVWTFAAGVFVTKPILDRRTRVMARRRRVIREREDRGVEDVCWDFCRHADYLRALSFAATRQRAGRLAPERLLKAVK